MMGVQSVIVLVMVTAAAAYLGRLAWRAFSSPGTCRCRQGPEAGQAGGIKKLPLVTPDQIGRPSGKWPGQDDQTDVCTAKDS